MTELHQSLRNIELSIKNLEQKKVDAKQALASIHETESKLLEKVEHIDRELKILNEMRDGAMKPLPMKKRKWRHVSGNEGAAANALLDLQQGNSSPSSNADDYSSPDDSNSERPLKRRRTSIDSEYTEEDSNHASESFAHAQRVLQDEPISATNSMVNEEIYAAHNKRPTQKRKSSISQQGSESHDFNSLVDEGSNNKKLPALLSNIPCSTICHAYPIPTTIELIEGFNYDDVGVQPGGKRNSAKDTLPQQVIELKGYFKESMTCKVEVLGLVKKVNRMEVIGFLDKQTFVQTADNRYLAMFNNCCCRFSSHSYGQKLALRFTLLDEDKEICYVDSKCFQTITRRGREKQNKKMAQKGGWTTQQIANLLEGVKRFGPTAFAQIQKSYEWDQWQTVPVLQKKYLQLLKA